MGTERYVLFSPVGMTDPISDYHDGSMLHIARVYRPEKIYLYLSKETMDFRDLDNRYRAALDLLGKKLGVNFEVEEIPRPELTEVQLFDFFYDDFEKLLSKIREENPSAVVLLNVSSGSPAMKSALQVIAALDEKAGYVPIQVASPNRAHNEHDDKPKDFNLEIFWEANEDNSENYKNRTSVSNNFSFLTKIRKEIIKRHLDVFDYHAALLLAEESTKGVSDKAKAYLRAACARVQLDAKSVDAHLASDSLRAGSRLRQFFVPVQGAQFRAVAEYLLWLDVKLKRAEYCDFIRGISPVFLDLLEAAADKACGIKIADFCRTTREGKRSLSRDKMEMSDKGRTALPALDAAFGGFQTGSLSPAQLVPIIEALSGDEKLKALVQKLRGAEQDCRNIAAHEIVSVTAGWIENRCGLTPQDILAGLNDLGEYAGIKRSVLQGSYEKMNELIKDSL